MHSVQRFISVAGDYVEMWQNITKCSYLVVNCQATNFWTPLVRTTRNINKSLYLLNKLHTGKNNSGYRDNSSRAEQTRHRTVTLVYNYSNNKVKLVRFRGYRNSGSSWWAEITHIGCVYTTYLTLTFETLSAIFVFWGNEIACSAKTTGQMLTQFYMVTCGRWFCEWNKSRHSWP